MKYLYLILGSLFLPFMLLNTIQEYLDRKLDVSFARIFKSNWELYWSDWVHFFEPDIKE